ncbi:unnamed protein product, partial [Ectocarpus sp. 6 AP-2014]
STEQRTRAGCPNNAKKARMVAGQGGYIENMSGVSSRVWWRVYAVRSLILLVSVGTFACILHDTKLLRLLRVNRVATISCGDFGAIGTKLAFPASWRSIKPKRTPLRSTAVHLGVTVRRHVGGVFYGRGSGLRSLGQGRSVTGSRRFLLLHCVIDRIPWVRSKRRWERALPSFL